MLVINLTYTQDTNEPLDRGKVSAKICINVRSRAHTNILKNERPTKRCEWQSGKPFRQRVVSIQFFFAVRSRILNKFI